MGGAHHKYRFTGSEKFIKIQRWITHPNARDWQNDRPYGKWFKDILYYDYSLLLLARKVKYTNNIRPIALPANSDQTTPASFSSHQGGETQKYCKDTTD